MKKLLHTFATILFLSLLCACGSSGGGNTSEPSADIIDTKVAATVAALTQATPTQATPQASPTLSETGTVESGTTVQPTFTLSLTPTLTPETSPTETSTPNPEPGTIAGAILGYPYGDMPAMVVVAIEQEAPYNYSYVLTNAGTAYFSLSGKYVVPGKWMVVAYDAAGNSGGCPTVVTVISEKTVTCDVTDWSGAYPAKPSGIPNP